MPHGTVLFSTMMVPALACFATVRVAPSTALTSAMDPAPSPCILVGVLTQMKTMSALAMASTTLVEKTRLGWRALS